MSSFEYYDLFLKSQNNGEYHMFTFDLKDSKKMNSNDRLDAMYKMRHMLKDIYNYLKEVELIIDQKIVLDQCLVENELWMPNEPYFMGDACEITIYRNSISDDLFYEIFNKFKNKYNFNYELHITDGYYETNKWVEGRDKFARTYCFDILSNKHKKQ